MLNSNLTFCTFSDMPVTKKHVLLVSSGTSDQHQFLYIGTQDTTWMVTSSCYRHGSQNWRCSSAYRQVDSVKVAKGTIGLVSVSVTLRGTTNIRAEQKCQQCRKQSSFRWAYSMPHVHSCHSCH